MEKWIEHLKAVLKASDGVMQHAVLGKRMVTNGHFAIVVGDDFEVAARETESIVATLAKHAAVARESLVHLETQGWSRTELIWARLLSGLGANEAYLRCFPEGTEFFARQCEIDAARGERWEGVGPILCFLGNEFVGCLMPLQMRKSFAGILTSDPPTDAEVFEFFACDANDYYMQPAAVAMAKVEAIVDRLRDDLAGKRSKISDLESDARELESDIRYAEARLKTMREKVA
jgi:hypothetical protein